MLKYDGGLNSEVAHSGSTVHARCILQTYDASRFGKVPSIVRTTNTRSGCPRYSPGLSGSSNRARELCTSWVSALRSTMHQTSGVRSIYELTFMDYPTMWTYIEMT